MIGQICAIQKLNKIVIQITTLCTESLCTENVNLFLVVLGKFCSKRVECVTHTRLMLHSTVGIQKPDMSGFQMVKIRAVGKWSIFPMV